MPKFSTRIDGNALSRPFNMSTNGNILMRGTKCVRSR